MEFVLIHSLLIRRIFARNPIIFDFHFNFTLFIAFNKFYGQRVKQKKKIIFSAYLAKVDFFLVLLQFTGTNTIIFFQRFSFCPFDSFHEILRLSQAIQYVIY